MVESAFAWDVFPAWAPNAVRASGPYAPGHDLLVTLGWARTKPLRTVRRPRGPGGSRDAPGRGVFTDVQRAAYQVAFVWRACHTRYADDKRPRGPLPSPGIVGTTLFQALSPPPCPTAGTSSPGPVRCPGRTNGTTARQGCGALPRGRSPPPGDPRMMMPPIHTV